MPPTLKQLIRRHPDHKQQCDRWQLLDALVKGGCRVDSDIKRKLLVNPDNRPHQVIDERVKVARYFNKIGPIINRFLSSLFATPIQIEGSKDKWWQENFFPGGALLDNDDDGRSSFNSFLRSATLQALSTGKAIAQIDTVAADALTRADQKLFRADEPYVLLVPRCDLWDWETDRDGFKFAKIHRFKWVRDDWSSEPVGEHDFTIYQRQPDRRVVASRYSARVRDAKKDTFDEGRQSDLFLAEESEVEIQAVNNLEQREIFHVKNEYLFPIVSMTLPNALWIADQLYDAQASHFNQSASLEYGLISSNYATLTITSSDIEDFTERNNKFGEGYYAHLDPEKQESIAWTERPGTSFNTSMEYRGKIEDDIDKTVQQIALSAADAVTSTSGEAIKQARKPEEILLSTYAGLTKEFGQQILAVAAIARGEITNWKVSGLEDLETVDVSAASQEYQSISQAQIPSETFNKEYQKSFVREVAKAKQFEPTVLKKMLGEIEIIKKPTNEADSEDDSQVEGDITEEASEDELLKTLGL